MTTNEIIGAFHALYAGGLAQAKRDAGESNAMPPWTEVYWLGRQVVKCPVDLWVYQEIICETKPEVLIETGTSGGGSASGHVITVDTVRYPELWKPHPRITYLQGSSVDGEIARQMAAASAGKRTMVSLDSMHTYSHVKRELELYGGLVSPGCYLVVEDTGWSNPDDTPAGEWADRAAKEFLLEHPDYVSDVSREKHLLTSNRGGWIKRLR